VTSQTYRFPLPPHPVAADQARIITRLALAEWGMNGITDNALLVTAELVTNAMKIGEVFQLTLSRQSDTVLIEVSDSSEASPDPQKQSLHRVDGRGLLLVEACSKDWGWRLEDHGGKTVWALCAEAHAEPRTTVATPPSAIRI
jgi:hypothetical protein